MAAQFEQLKKTWVELGESDPLWAIISLEEKRGRKWGLKEFLETGELDVSRYCRLLAAHAHCEPPFDHVLDFGCGVGRLSLAWSPRARAVTGLDISNSMIEKGRALTAEIPNLRLLVNDQPNLRIFPEAEFDLVFSHICLQHIPWPITARYLGEFARVCRPGGWIIFQLPTHARQSQRAALLRKWIIDHLPFGLGRQYRQWKHGSSVVFDMHYTPASLVIETARAAGLTLIHREPDSSAGELTDGFVYLFQKPSS